MSVLGVVAAAGASRRMGRAKALLPTAHDGPPFVVVVVNALLHGGVDDVVVTVPDDARDAAAIEAAVEAAVDEPRRLRVSFVRNAAPTLGLSGSVRTALARATNETTHLVVAPVDAPFFDAALVRALLASAWTPPHGPVDVVVPVIADGRRGHPVVFARATFDALLAAGDRGGPAIVVDEAAAVGRAALVPCDDERVVDDVDTPDEWERAFGARGVRAPASP